MQELDVLWVSLDGATPEGFGDVRLGAELPLILENLRHLFNCAAVDISPNLRSVLHLLP